MYMTNIDRYTLLTDSLTLFISDVRKSNKYRKVYDDWSVKEILCHVTFWHINYAENLIAEEENKERPLLKGKYSVINTLAFKTLRRFSTENIIKKLVDANMEIGEVVKRGKVSKMTYKEGARDYSMEEFLDMIEAHIRNHAKDIRRRKRK